MLHALFLCAPCALASEAPRVLRPSQGETAERAPGVLLRVFELEGELTRLPEVAAERAPDVELVVPRVELFGPEAFGGVEDNFLTIVLGFVETNAGVYGLRLSSDDGSRMILDGSVVLDNDGLHAHASVEASVELAAGLHAFEIRHFDASGAQSLVLEWRPPGSYAFEVVPAAALSRPAGAAASPPAAGGAPPEHESTLLHPSYALSRLAVPGLPTQVRGLAWSGDGRLLVLAQEERTTEAPTTGSIWALDGFLGGDPAAIRLVPVARDLPRARALAESDGRIFALADSELLELVDSDGDGVAEERRVLADLADALGSDASPTQLLAADGRLFAALEPPSPALLGMVVAVDPTDGGREVAALGLRRGSALGVGDGGLVFLAEPPPANGRLTRLLRLADATPPVGPGAASPDLVLAPHVAAFPLVVGGGRASAPCVIPPGNGPYSGQMLLTGTDRDGTARAFLETTDGVLQGSVHPFTRTRADSLCFGSHGVLYLASSDEGGLARVRHNGETTFEMLAVRAFRNGFEVEFTEPIASGSGFDPFLWELETLRGAPDAQELTARSSTPSEDRTKVFVEIPHLRAGSVVRIAVAHRLEAESGRRLWSDEAWYTLNHLPRSLGEALADPGPKNALSEEEREAGWTLLFDGESLGSWRGFRRENAPEGWAVVDGALTRVASAGELVTRETFEDFELSFEWKLSRGGNSGVFFRVSEEVAAAWETGPELQLRDDATHPDGAHSVTSTGGNYGLHAPTEAAALPVGRWNHALLRVWDDRVEHWLNGVKVVDYRLGSEDWQRRLAASKFADLPGYARAASGHIALQDNGDFVAFRNVKIRRL